MAAEKTFSIELIFDFCKNKILKQLAGGNTIENNKSNNKYEGKCMPCKSGYTVTVLFTGTKHTFRSQQNERILTMVHQVKCKSSFVIYFFECKKCHIHYVDKAETVLNLRLNNHGQDVYKADGIPASRHFDLKAISLTQTRISL